jgi:hypothetical protein
MQQQQQQLWKNNNPPRLCTSAMSESNASSAWMTYIAPPNRLQDHRQTMETRDDRRPAAKFKTRNAGTVEAPLKASSMEAISGRTGPLALRAARPVGSIGTQLVPPKRPLFFLFFFLPIFPMALSLFSSSLSFFHLLLPFSLVFIKKTETTTAAATTTTTKNHWLSFVKEVSLHEKTGGKKSHNQIDRPKSPRPRENHRLLRFCLGT